MCTAFSLTSKDNNHFFGRNMDVEYSFNQRVGVIPRQFPWTNVITNEEFKTKYAIIAMTTMMGKHPMIAGDGMNEKGLCFAGLNFPHFAGFEEEVTPGDVNIGPYDYPLYVLGNYASVAELRNDLPKIHLINKAFAPGVAIAPLHWIAYDITGASIVIEWNKGVMNVFDNPLGILTNSPSFDWHMMNLNNYANLNIGPVAPVKWGDVTIQEVGAGSGMSLLSASVLPANRFVRAAFMKTHPAFIDTADSTIAQFFASLASIAFIGGTVGSASGAPDITLYTSCMWIDKGIYMYRPYHSQGIYSVDMNKEDLDATDIKFFDFLTTTTITAQN